MLSRDDLLDLDRQDPLGALRDRFLLPEGTVYLDGNSLGAQVRQIPDAAAGVLDEWRHLLIGGWTQAGWWELPLRLGDRIGALIGAAPGRVLVCDTTTANLYKTLYAALELQPDRRVILVEESSFPTDRYVVDSVAAHSGREVRVVRRGDRVARGIDGSVAVAVLNHVDFRTAEILDLDHTTAAAHAAGALVIWDLSHSAGVLPMRLDEAGVDYAVGCTYKYLNGGPGAPAYLYVNQRILGDSSQPVQGWLGHTDPFAMRERYEPAIGIRRFLTGTQPVVSMRLVEAAMAVFDEVDLDDIRAKSVRLTDLFVHLVDERCDGMGFEVVSPRDATRRGSQVTLHHPDAVSVFDRLVAAGLRGDFRPPGLLRFGFAPLYTSHTDVWDAVEILRRVGH